MTLSYSHGTTSTAAPMLTAYIAAKNLAFPRVRTLKNYTCPDCAGHWREYERTAPRCARPLEQSKIKTA